jgi:hypothetical protein
MPKIIYGAVTFNSLDENTISFVVTLSGSGTPNSSEGYNYAHGTYETAEALNAALLENVMLDHAETGDRVYLTGGGVVIAQSVKG